MDNNYITVVASLALSSDPFFDVCGMTPFETIHSISRDVVESRSNYSLDMRINARTADDVGIFFHELLATVNGPPFDAFCNHGCNEVIQLMTWVDKTNYLIHGASFADFADIVSRRIGRGGNLNYLNSGTLYLYEKFVRGKFGHESIVPYSVLLPSDLGDSLPDADKFTFIALAAVRMIGEEALLQSMIDSLTPGGVLALIQSNHERGVYMAAYFTDGMYAMHQILLANDGITIHSSSGSGITIFTKSRPPLDALD